LQGFLRLRDPALRLLGIARRACSFEFLTSRQLLGLAHGAGRSRGRLAGGSQASGVLLAGGGGLRAFPRGWWRWRGRPNASGARVSSEHLESARLQRPRQAARRIL
jgi:hypothetical protein